MTKISPFFFFPFFQGTCWQDAAKLKCDTHLAPFPPFFFSKVASVLVKTCCLRGFIQETKERAAEFGGSVCEKIGDWNKNTWLLYVVFLYTSWITCLANPLWISWLFQLPEHDPEWPVTTQRYSCCWLKAWFQPYFSLLLFRLFRKVLLCSETFYWHVANLWSLLFTNQTLHLLRDESCMVWCYFYSPLCPESCIVKLWWQWVHTVYNLAFCISPVVLLKSFVAAQRVGFQQIICLKFLLGKQEHTKQCASFPMPGAGEISLSVHSFKCRRKWIKQHKTPLQQNLLHSLAILPKIHSHLLWNPVMEGQSQNLCVFLGLHQKSPMSPHRFKLFVYDSRAKGLSGSGWTLRCREEPTQCW